MTKTNLAVHEDKNRVPYVKVGKKYYQVNLNQKESWNGNFYFFGSFQKEERKEKGRSGKYKDYIVLYSCYGYTWTAIYVINRGYYMATWGYEFYLRVLKVSLLSEQSEWVRDTFSTRR